MLPNCMEYFKNSAQTLNSSTLSQHSAQVDASFDSHLQTASKTKTYSESNSQNSSSSNNNNNINSSSNNINNTIPVISSIITPPISNSQPEITNTLFGNQYVYGVDPSNPQYGHFSNVNPTINEDAFFNFSKKI